MLEVRRINDHISIGMLDLAVFSAQNNIIVKRDLEKTGTRYLLENLLKGEQVSLAYTAENKPYLSGRPEHISISHSHDKLVIIINTKENTGIDIEQIRDKVINIQHKFLSAAEQAFAEGDPVKLITMWAAKEAMYKVHGLRKVEFIKNLFVEPFEGNRINGSIRTENFYKRYRLTAEQIENYQMVYVLHEL